MQQDASPFSLQRQRHQIGRYDLTRSAALAMDQENLGLEQASRQAMTDRRQRGPNNFSRRSKPHPLLERSAPRPNRLDLWFGHAEKAQNKPPVVTPSVLPTPKAPKAKGAPVSKAVIGFFDNGDRPRRSSGHPWDPSASNKKFWSLEID